MKLFEEGTNSLAVGETRRALVETAGGEDMLLEQRGACAGGRDGAAA